MAPAVYEVLIKIFGKGFYKAHSGLLLFLFVVIFSHCFWMKPLGGHLTHEESVYHHLIMVLTFTNDPVMMTIVFISWLIYTVKSLNYVEKQLAAPENNFLKYSFIALSIPQQFGSWLMVQLVILLPAILYGFFASIIGLIYHNYLIPSIIPVYLLLLIFTSASWHVWKVKRTFRFDKTISFFHNIPGLGKPFFSLFLFHLLDKLKIAYSLTKIFSWVIITGCSIYFSDLKEDLRLSGFIVLLLAVVNSLLLFEQQKFEEVYLQFSKNFPFSKLKIYVASAVTYLILTIPESLWIISTFDFTTGLLLILFNVSVALLFRSFLFMTGLNISRYLKAIFTVFIIYFLVILFGFLSVLIPINFVIAFLVFRRSH